MKLQPRIQELLYNRGLQTEEEMEDMIEELTAVADSLPINELFELMLEKTGYIRALLAEGREGQDRAENVKELASGIIQYQNENEEATLSGYLEEIALVSDIDSYEAGDDAVVLMTVHSAKGLEFGKVFLVGMEQGLFPSSQSMFGGIEELEEENAALKTNARTVEDNKILNAVKMAGGENWLAKHCSTYRVSLRTQSFKNTVETQASAEETSIQRKLREEREKRAKK